MLCAQLAHYRDQCWYIVTAGTRRGRVTPGYQGPGVVTILQEVVGAFSLIVKTDRWFAALVWSNLSPVCHGSPYFNSPQQEAGTLLAPGGSLPLVFCNPNIDAHV